MNYIVEEVLTFNNDIYRPGDKVFIRFNIVTGKEIKVEGKIIGFDNETYDYIELDMSQVFKSEINKIYIKDIVGIYKESELKKESEEDGENENKLKEENKELYEKLAAVMDERDKLRYINLGFNKKIKDNKDYEEGINKLTNRIREMAKERENERKTFIELLKSRNKDTIYEIVYMYGMRKDQIFKGKISDVNSVDIEMTDEDKKEVYILTIINIKSIKDCGVDEENNSLSIEIKEIIKEDDLIKLNKSRNENKEILIKTKKENSEYIGYALKIKDNKVYLKNTDDSTDDIIKEGILVINLIDIEEVDYI